MTLEDIQRLVGLQWNAYERQYSELVHSTIELLDEVGSYQMEHSGKHLRPLLLLLSAAIADNNHPQLPQLAASMELLHNASLMHDDVVDDDTMRRGAPSVQRKWNIHVALLAGDYYLAEMMLLLHHMEDKSANERIIHTAIAMAEGEMIQQQLLFHPQQEASLSTYLRIIELKTAELMSCCCRLGAGNSPTAYNLSNFGLHYGMAFQLRDDISDKTGETYRWIPDSKALQSQLEHYLQLSNADLESLPTSDYRDALQQLINNIS